MDLLWYSAIDPCWDEPRPVEVLKVVTTEYQGGLIHHLIFAELAAGKPHSSLMFARFVSHSDWGDAEIRWFTDEHTGMVSTDCELADIHDGDVERCLAGEHLGARAFFSSERDFADLIELISEARC